MLLPSLQFCCRAVPEGRKLASSKSRCGGGWQCNRERVGWLSSWVVSPPSSELLTVFPERDQEGSSVQNTNREPLRRVRRL